MLLPRRSAVRGVAVGTGAVAVACALLLPLRDNLTFTVPPLVLVLPVLLAAVAGGRRAAVAVALVATLATNVVFTPPYGSLKVEVASDAVALGVFLVVALAVGALVATLVARSVAAEQRRDEMGVVNEQLRQVIVERERLAVEASRVEALVQIDEQRRALLRSVSHDLRTPLATIRAVTSDLADESAHDPATRVELLELVGDEAERLDRPTCCRCRASRPAPSPPTARPSTWASWSRSGCGGWAGCSARSASRCRPRTSRPWSRGTTASSSRW